MAPNKFTVNLDINKIDRNPDVLARLSVSVFYRLLVRKGIVTEDELREAFAAELKRIEKETMK